MKSRAEWRRWLSKNYNRSSGVWLVFYKRHSGKPTLEYDDAVEEALCFGWIDSTIRKIDDEKYVRKFTPRNPNSRWSEPNKKRVNKLIRQGLMTDAGLARVKDGKKSGAWNKPDRPTISLELPPELETALAKNEKAKAFFDQLAPSSRKQYIGWVFMAKRPETKARRVAESIKLLEQGKKLGLK
ncbi:MAG: YdeI/OmpD-associated family protein [Candidatus Zixiibacteriota bacterium]|nr:MAG: YdeI/OmpD-associated family protein [candidate division Zixibacteria bacterium]